MKQKTKQVLKQKARQVYEARIGAPFKQEEAQAIGEFIEECSDKTTRGILERIKNHQGHPIYKLFEWDKDKQSELYLLQRVREIISHIEVKIISIGSQEPINLSVNISAFKSIKPSDSEERIYVSIEEGMTNLDYRTQIIQRAKVELKNWMERYQQYQELSSIVKVIKPLINKL